MKEFFAILLIGISVSMDTFSLSLSIGPMLKDSKYTLILPTLVAVFHYIMPLVGVYLGIKIMDTFSLASNILLGIVLIVLGINLLINYFNDKEIEFKVGFWGSMLVALSVSIDAFSVGLGISDVTNNFLMSAIIISSCSFVFTYLGLIIGKYSHKFIGKYASLLGIVLLIVIGIYHLLF